MATPEVEASLASGAVVAIGVSGGKDSSLQAYELRRYLDAIGHGGDRILIHAHLGRIEWADSLPACERLARELGMELVVVERQAGDMIARWESRWASSVRRYANLECVKVILPWSTASMRFCTSELKQAVIASYLRRRFSGQTIVSATGIRRQESPVRAKATIASGDPRTGGLAWRPILHWTEAQVFSRLKDVGHDLHEAYSRFGSSRVSCSFCILSSLHDQLAAASDDRNHESYRLLVALEILSTFAFQSGRWLADLAPGLLSPETIRAACLAKERARLREEAEATIPKHLLYTKGWPTCIPSAEDALLLANVRNRVAEAVGIEIGYTTPDMIRDRYRELMREPSEVDDLSTRSVWAQSSFADALSV
ncbi:MAG: phosphoadenosine phosphosulfate reductase domain-containing protein [Chloroflexota bacterium]